MYKNVISLTALYMCETSFYMPRWWRCIEIFWTEM